MRTPFAVSSSIGLMLLIIAPPAGGQSHKWGYDAGGGPSKWAAIDPSFAACAAGKAQSPINIKGAKPADLPAIAFDYHPVPLQVIDNGHTIQVDYAPGSSITVGGHAYQLVQFHFHHPSENHVGGKAFPMELHLVHKDSDGKLAVVAVLLKVGAENPAIRAEWSHLPPEKEKEVTVEGVTIDAAQLLPAKRGYYTFQGSLTTPPCSEGVTWFVLKEPLSISKDELTAFSRLYRHDNRPVQPLGDRVVEASR